MSAPLLTVIVPAYNLKITLIGRSRRRRRCGDELEVFIVNDGSAHRGNCRRVGRPLPLREGHSSRGTRATAAPSMPVCRRHLARTRRRLRRLADRRATNAVLDCCVRNAS